MIEPVNEFHHSNFAHVIVLGREKILLNLNAIDCGLTEGSRFEFPMRNPSFFVIFLLLESTLREITDFGFFGNKVYVRLNSSAGR